MQQRANFDPAEIAKFDAAASRASFSNSRPIVGSRSCRNWALSNSVVTSAIGGLLSGSGIDSGQDHTDEVLGGSAEELLKYPDLARSALEVRPIGDNTLRFADHLMALLAEGGITEKRRALGMDLLMLWTMGGAAEHAADVQDPASPSATIEAFRLAVADPEKYPNLHAVRDELFLGSETTRFAWGVDALLTGITASNDPGAV